MIHTMQEPMEKVVHLGSRFPNEISEEAAKQVLDVVGLPEGKCVYLSSGSEAVEFGVQVTRRISAKPLLPTLSGSYLAAYGSAGKKSPEEWYIFDQDDFLDVRAGYLRNQICDHLLERGFLVGAHPVVNLLRFYPSLIIREDEIDRLLENLSQILDKMDYH
jgi:4-aminobutyrate aminotransferase-like enzyme